MNGALTRGRARRMVGIVLRVSVAITSALALLAAIASPAQADYVGCTYDGIDTVTVQVEADTYAWLHLVRSVAGEVSVFDGYAEDPLQSPPLVCDGGDGADPATTVVIESAGDYYASLLVPIANWTADTSISVVDPDEFLLLLLGSAEDDMIHTSELPFHLEPVPLVVGIEGLGGNDDLALEDFGGSDFEGGGINGGPGDDVIVSPVENAYLWGDDGDDVIKGASSGEWGANLDGGPGDDMITGGDGNDWQIDGGPGDDVIDGGAGNDRLLGGDGDDRLIGGDGDDWIDGDIEAWYGDTEGQPGNDRIDGGAGDDYINGWGGNDQIDGGPGNDGVDGGEGDDVLAGGEGNDWVTAWAGDDVLDGGPGDDYLFGGEGNDHLDGGEGNDGLGGESGSDILMGGEGNDGLFDGYRWRAEQSSDDQLFGDAGEDFLFTGGTFAARLDGGADADGCEGYSGDPSGSGKYARVDYVDCERAETYWAACSYNPLDGGAVEVSVHGGGAVISLQRDPDGAVTVNVSEYEYRRNRPDGITEGYVLSCAGGATANVATSVAVNGAGSGSATDVYLHLANWTPDTSVAIHDLDDRSVDDWDLLRLVGTAGADTIDMGDLGLALTADAVSSVEVYGEGGDDVLIEGVLAGVGGAALYGGDGDDLLIGDSDSQYLSGDGGDDVIIAGSGDDSVLGGTGDDSLQGDEGDDYLDGDEGDDLLSGGEGDDYLSYGTASYRSSTGAGGADLLDGGDGEDYCYGYFGDSLGVRLFSRVTYEGCELDPWYESLGSRDRS